MFNKLLICAHQSEVSLCPVCRPLVTQKLPNYRIDEAVRIKLGDLVSQHGSPEEARKLDHEATRKPLNGRERNWIEQVVKALIRRKAGYDANPNANRPMLTMADLPKQS